MAVRESFPTKSLQMAFSWRRRESNPRPRTHRLSVYKLRPRLGIRPDGWFTTDPPPG